MPNYLVKDPFAKKIAGVALNSDGTVTLTERQAFMPLHNGQITPAPVIAGPAEAAPIPAVADPRDPTSSDTKPAPRKRWRR